jgi:hypothetical protein
MKTTNKLTGIPNLFTQSLAIFWPPIIVFSFHVFLVRVLHVYDFYPWLDIPMHYLGGLSMAYSLFAGQAALQSSRVISRLDQPVERVLVFTSVATIAVFWEFAEFLLDRTLGTELQISLSNTMQDLLMGILGAGTLVFYTILKSPKRKFASSSD